MDVYQNLDETGLLGERELIQVIQDDNSTLELSFNVTSEGTEEIGA